MLRDVQQTNFLLACSAVIPLLALAALLELRAYGMPKMPPQIPVRRVRIAQVAQFVGFLTIVGVTGWGEFVCLRSLEVGRLVAGGTGIAWAAITAQTALIVARFAVRALAPPA